ncbi:MAG: hypothetical protein DHS20C14_14430 [Phycisphaeraceae bacterium]|nr:MAG: hypothetical protein DHS20C14_14430 [Phycisphaeraceae bacterium]
MSRAMPSRAGQISERVTWDPDEGADLRRRRAGAWVDRVLDRSAWLPPSERTLVESVFRDGRTAVEIARLSNADARRVRRRIRRAVDRAMSPRLAFVMTSRAAWSPTRRRIADLLVIEGLSMRGASDRLGVSYHTVRRHKDAIDALFAEASARSPRRGVA